MHQRRVLRAAAAVGLVVVAACSADGTVVGPPPAADVTWTHPDGSVQVAVTASPFGLVVRAADGHVLLETTPGADGAYAPLAFTHDDDQTTPAVMNGWDNYRGVDGPWNHAAIVTSTATDGSALVLHVATDDAARGSTITVRIEPAAGEGDGVHLVASLDAPDGDPSTAYNRLSLGLAMHDDAPGAPGDHFLGLGERFYLTDHRGQDMYVWVEDKGFGQGEGTPPGPGNPLPNGPAMTYIPIPWTMSPRGFGVFLSTTFRTVFHLGDEQPDAWRIEAWEPKIDASIFVSPDPNVLVSDLTAVTGRPPAVADWVLAPRRRGDPGSGEWDKLRAAHVPTSVIDADPHYFPNGGGADHALMKATTAELHAKGFKAVSYFCPFVADSWHPVFDMLAANGWLLKHTDGSVYTMLDVPYNAAMVDFSNPDATAWYQQQMQVALDDGWDGWMYDFAEYTPMDAVLANGMTGMEAHNLYPLLYQKAVHDLMEKQLPGNYLVFVRSGYAAPVPWGGIAGTGGLVPMVWAGDESTDFNLADGLPAALVAALNAGMSGIPLWGSDISGYHYIYNPPPDKEVYLRWTELGAFSADMHDENGGAGTLPASARWQIWKDQETLTTYAAYASLKTRMLPYVKLAVKQARAGGRPVMRHLFLDHPDDPRVWSIGDEYMYGDSLLVAPVVTRGQTSRSVYLPDAAYFDYWSGARVAGLGDVTAPAGLDAVPVYARVGAIVPMLAPDVETVVAAPNGGVVSAADRAGFLQVDVFAGGTTSVTLDDGTTLAQSAPATAFDPAAPSDANGPIGAAASDADLMTCTSCYHDDPAAHTWSVAVTLQPGQMDTIHAGALTLDASGSSIVKKFLFRVRH